MFRTDHRRAESAFGIEALEPRQLLAADLSVGFNNSGSDIPSTLVPGDTPFILLNVRNNGPMSANGLVTVQFYLSTDVTFGSSDRLLRAFNNEPLFLSSQDTGTFGDDVSIPSDVEPGNYFILARIIPDDDIDDTNQSNNVAATDNALPVVLRFGSFAGRTDVALAITDADGDVVRFSMPGGGSGTVTKTADGLNVVTTGTGTNSRATMTVTGGDGITRINDFTVNGSLDFLNAPGARLTGDLSVTGSARSITLHSLTGVSTTATVTIGTEPSGAGVTITAGDVSNASIVISAANPVGTGSTITLGLVVNLAVTTPGGLSLLSVQKWSDTDATADTVSAGWIQTLTSAGNFAANLQLSGRAGGLNTLNTVAITGQLTGGSWGVTGKGGAVSVNSVGINWSGSFSSTLGSFTAATGVFRGVLAAQRLTTFNVAGDVNRGQVLIGANLGSDGRLGGTGAAADQFRAGQLTSVNIDGRVIRGLIGVGLNPVDGIFDNGNDVIIGGAGSKLFTLVIDRTTTQNSRFLAGRVVNPVTINGATINPVNDRRFVVFELVPPTSTVFGSSILLNAATGTVQVRFTDNKGIDVSRLGTGDIRVTGPNGFSQVLTFVSVNITDDGKPRIATYSIASPGGTWDAADNGTYTVFVEAGRVFDTSGNALGAGIGGQIGQFTVAV